jgi:predicted RNA binding protein YcfA (HicA-like mRNA interferase family)
MTRLPRLKGKELIRILQKFGFEVIRSRGSHFFLQHPDGRVTTVPVHSGEVLGPGLLRSILRDVELTAADLLNELSTSRIFRPKQRIESLQPDNRNQT